MGKGRGGLRPNGWEVMCEPAPAAGSRVISDSQRDAWELLFLTMNKCYRRGGYLGGQVVRLRWVELSLASSLGVLVVGSPAQSQAIGGCRFDPQTLRFAGSVADTAKCLLRRVRDRGSGADEQPIPAWLLERITRPVSFTPEQLRTYLRSQEIDPAALTVNVAVGDRPQVRYFVIHDTSSPEIASSGTQFPANIDQPSYSGNNLSGWQNLRQRVNLIVSRDGRSRTFVDWGADRSLPATKIEMNSRVPRARPIFVHVENVQPRIKPPGSWAWRAPDPGFSRAQEQRLALAYIVASARAGRWLIPAYHFNIDQRLPDVHDDPQHANLASWVAHVQAIEAEVVRRP